jgi:hypothetical protein
MTDKRGGGQGNSVVSVTATSQLTNLEGNHQLFGLPDPLSTHSPPSQSLQGFDSNTSYLHPTLANTQIQEGSRFLN